MSLGCGNKGFGGHAANIEAIASHGVGLDKRHLGPQTGGTGGGNKTGRTSSQNYKVIDLFRPRWGIMWWKNVLLPVSVRLSHFVPQL